MAFSQQDAARQLRSFSRVWQRVTAANSPAEAAQPEAGAQPSLPLMPRRRGRCCGRGGRR